MTDMFSRYLQSAGLASDEADAEAAAIAGWDDLRAWLDRNRCGGIQPVPRRRLVVPPPIRTSRRGGVRDVHDPDALHLDERGWENTVRYRQRVSLALTGITTAGILLLSATALRAQQMPVATMRLYLVVYGLMTFFLASNFFKLMLGTWHMLHGAARNPWHPSHVAVEPRDDVRCAIVFPVYHEDATRVAAGMAATWASLALARSDLADRFDLLLLSDSRNPEFWIAEQAAVHALRRDLPDARIRYRHRASNSNAKMGNIADFCRRWGQDYEYMLVMDADSLMDGEAIVALFRMMEGNDRIGILQTNPKPILRESLFGRMQQFAARLYGSVFSYGLQAMFMGHASYIGHNAMIRIAPFVRHCILPELSGAKPWGGKPLSHDIVESAMMARAGYEVWFLPGIVGSYEEVPANLLGFLVRERRWMQGNLQHLRFLFLRGLRPVHRETFLSGSMGYLAAPLWAVFLVVSAWGMVRFLQSGSISIGGLRELELPMTMLFVSSIVFLFMPRLLAVAIVIKGTRARGYGGKDKLLWSVLLETLFSFFFSPIMMIFVCRFVWLWARRKGISWGTQQRDDAPLSWRDCIEHFGWVSIVGAAAWGILVFALSRISSAKAAMILTFSGGWLRPNDLLLWYFPIVGGFAFSTVIARFTSRTFPSLVARRLFTIPEEIDEPPVVADLIRWHAHLSMIVPATDDAEAAFAFALDDVGFYVDHRPATRNRPRVAGWLLPRIVQGATLSPREMLLAIGERRCFDRLHADRADRRAA